ncbi:MAG: hypothetical protein NUW37_12635 [Planctomycetes bacterium]|nr:hypothetical protein [Planctomycetota bacterium]
MFAFLFAFGATLHLTGETLKDGDVNPSGDNDDPPQAQQPETPAEEGHSVAEVVFFLHDPSSTPADLRTFGSILMPRTNGFEIASFSDDATYESFRQRYDASEEGIFGKIADATHGEYVLSLKIERGESTSFELFARTYEFQRQDVELKVHELPSGDVIWRKTTSSGPEGFARRYLLVLLDSWRIEMENALRGGASTSLLLVDLPASSGAINQHVFELLKATVGADVDLKILTTYRNYLCIEVLRGSVREESFATPEGGKPVLEFAGREEGCCVIRYIPANDPAYEAMTDSIPPTVEFVSPTGTGFTTRESSFECVVAIVDANVSEVFIAGEAAPVSEGFARRTVALVEGRNSITAYAVDTADNRSQTVLTIIVRDTIAPEIAIEGGLEARYTKEDKLRISGTVKSERSPTDVEIDSFSARYREHSALAGQSSTLGTPVAIESALAGEAFSFEIEPPRGMRITFEIVLSDATGNLRTVSFDAIHDDAQPFIAPTNFTTDGVVKPEVGENETLFFTVGIGVNERNPDYIIIAGERSALETSTVNYRMPVVEGLNTLEIEVGDRAGRKRLVTFRFTADNTPPTLDIVKVEHATLIDTDYDVEKGEKFITIEGTALDANFDRLTVTLLSQNNPSPITVDSEGRFMHMLEVPAGERIFTLRFSALDLAQHRTENDLVFRVP